VLLLLLPLQIGSILLYTLLGYAALCAIRGGRQPWRGAVAIGLGGIAGAAGCLVLTVAAGLAGATLPSTQAVVAYLAALALSAVTGSILALQFAERGR
jgi:hypothetical protein